MSKEYEYIIPLKKKPEIASKGPASISRTIAKEFIDSGVQYAEVPLGKFDSITSLARSLGRALHGKNALDKENKIVVKSDKEKNKVYLIRE